MLGTLGSEGEEGRRQERRRQEVGKGTLFWRWSSRRKGYMVVFIL